VAVAVGDGSIVAVGLGGGAVAVGSSLSVPEQAVNKRDPISVRLNRVRPEMVQFGRFMLTLRMPGTQ
jgi:hypothetical protein